MVTGLWSWPVHWLFPLSLVIHKFLPKCHLLSKAFLDLPVTLFLCLPLIHSLMLYLQVQGFLVSCLPLYLLYPKQGLVHRGLPHIS